MVLRVAPRIDVITASVITALPDFHPEVGSGFTQFPVNVFLVHHADGPILIDTGIGHGNGAIDDWYRPRQTDLPKALSSNGVDLESVQMIVNTHLHFDHCGQNNVFPNSEIVVQRSEAEIAATPFYTVDEWAVLPVDRTRLISGDVEIADGVHVLHTPGHTPGHQSVVIKAQDEVIVVSGQCVFRAAEWLANEPSTQNLHDEDHRTAAADSLARLRALRPSKVYFSHDHFLCLDGTAW